MELWEYCSKNIRVICTNGIIVEGKCIGYTQAIDNTPELASITITNEETIKTRTAIEVCEKEIEKIEII